MFLIRDKITGLFYNGLVEGTEYSINTSFSDVRLYDSYDEALAFYEDYVYLDELLEDKIGIVDLSGELPYIN